MGRETSQVPAETRARDKFSLAPARASFQVPVLAARVSRFLRAAPAPCPLVRCRASRSLPKSAVSVQSQSTHLPLTDHPSWSLSGHFSYSNIKKQGGRSTRPETERLFCIHLFFLSLFLFCFTSLRSCLRPSADSCSKRPSTTTNFLRLLLLQLRHGRDKSLLATPRTPPLDWDLDLDLTAPPPPPPPRAVLRQNSTSPPHPGPFSRPHTTSKKEKKTPWRRSRRC